MAGTQIIDARHREALQPPGWNWRGSPSTIPLGALPAGMRLAVGPLAYVDAPPFLRSSLGTPASPVVGNPSTLVVNPRTSDLPAPPSWLFGQRIASVPPTQAPSGTRMVVAPRLDWEEPGALTLPGIIDSRLPFATRLVVAPVEPILNPGFMGSTFLGTAITPTTTPPLGAIAVNLPQTQEDKPVFSWLRNFNGAPFAPPTRLSAAAALVVRPVPQHDPAPFTWNFNGSPVIPGQRPAAGFQLIATPVGADTHIDAVMQIGVGQFTPSPPPIPGLTVPNVVGLYFYDAQLAILQAGFWINTPVEVDAPGEVLGIVLTQSIAPGSFFLLPQQITITVAAYLSPLPPLIA